MTPAGSCGGWQHLRSQLRLVFLGAMAQAGLASSPFSRFQRALSLTQCLGIFLLFVSRLAERVWGDGRVSFVGHCILKDGNTIIIKVGWRSFFLFKYFWQGQRVKAHGMVAEHSEDPVWHQGPCSPCVFAGSREGSKCEGVTSSGDLTSDFKGAAISPELLGSCKKGILA